MRTVNDSSTGAIFCHSVWAPRFHEQARINVTSAKSLGTFIIAPLTIQLSQSLCRQHQRLILFTKTKANLLRAQTRIAEETQARHTRNADFANQCTREFNSFFET